MDNHQVQIGHIEKIGWIAIFLSNKHIYRIMFLDKKFSKFKGFDAKPIEESIINWFKDYVHGKVQKFPFKLRTEGTKFQQEVWNALQKIPFGKVETYNDIAQKINRPKAARAVGNACGKNPIPIVIPCHRVVAKTNIGGFSSGIEMKKKLLSIESSIKSH